jgi:PAS domain S-box-containing protein
VSEPAAGEGATDAARGRRDHGLLEALVHAAPQAIVAVDPAWCVTHWNPAAEALFGWTAAEVLGRPVPTIPPADLAAFRADPEAVVRARLEGPFEAERRRKDGAPVTVSVATGVLRDADGRVAGYVGIMTDVTARRAHEARLREGQRLEALGRLAGGVAHDLNNLLAVVEGNADVLAAAVPDGPDAATGAEARAAADDLRDAAARGRRLVRQLLAFGRQQALAPRTVALTGVVAGAERLVRRLLGAEVRVVFALTDAPTWVRSDPDALGHALLNLVVNARDAMPAGGTLTVETARAAVEALPGTAVRPAFAAHGAVLLRVTDTGHGMDAATRTRAFEPFFTTKPVGAGTGLGLATVHGLAEQSGGAAWIESAPGQGTAVYLALPPVADGA